MGPNLVFRGRFADPASSSSFVFKRPNFGFRQTDRRTDGRTDRRNKHILGLPTWHAPYIPVQDPCYAYAYARKNTLLCSSFYKKRLIMLIIYAGIYGACQLPTQKLKTSSFCSQTRRRFAEGHASSVHVRLSVLPVVRTI